MQLETSLSWLALTLTPGVATRLSARFVREFGSPEDVFRAPLRRIAACNVPAPAPQAIFKKQMFWRAEKEVDSLRKVGAKLVHWKEPEFPQSLLQIYDPPVLLYVRGDTGVLNAPSISIVGTRRPTVYGTQMSERMGRDLAARGLVIVSGLTRGIDAIAYQGATVVGGRAIGGLGTGIDVCYPKERTRSCTRRSGGGGGKAIQRVGDHSAAGNGVWARGFWVPGNVTQEVSFAPNLLINQGAKLVTGAEDVIEELPTPVKAALRQAEAMEAEQHNLLAIEGLTPSEKKIYELLSADEPRPIDDIVETSGLNSSEVLATLFSLEMKGIVRQLPGKQFNKYSCSAAPPGWKCSNASEWKPEASGYERMSGKRHI